MGAIPSFYVTKTAPNCTSPALRARTLTTEDREIPCVCTTGGRSPMATWGRFCLGVQAEAGETQALDSYS